MDNHVIFFNITNWHEWQQQQQQEQHLQQQQQQKQQQQSAIQMPVITTLPLTYILPKVDATFAH